jgi:lipoate-protein ligase A
LERATTVESASGMRISWERTAHAFIRAFETQLGLSFENGELSNSESRRTKELVEEKYAHPFWTERV